MGLPCGVGELGGALNPAPPVVVEPVDAPPPKPVVDPVDAGAGADEPEVPDPVVEKPEPVPLVPLVPNEEVELGLDGNPPVVEPLVMLPAADALGFA